ncbi:MAG: type B 50S ribosomal protein L31 [Proteobacteria bacterium]|nr:type B 50S ribosomal protein L31 [Pseudomonadota bacterium]
MKEGIHPEYRKVVFVDVSTGTEFVTRSTVRSDKTREVGGEELPEVRVEISSASHPFYTGTMREIDTAGKIERFRRRYQKSSK